MANEPLMVKAENIRIFDIEENDSFNDSMVTEETKKAIMDFDINVTQKLLLEHSAPCPCQQAKIFEKLQRQSMITGRPIPPQIQITQEIVDTREFGVITHCVNGVPKNIEALVVGCKGCKHLEIFADVDVVTRLLAGSVNQKITMRKAMGHIPDENGNMPEYVLENTETGEITPAKDIADALFGSDSGIAPSDLIMKDVPPAE